MQDARRPRALLTRRAEGPDSRNDEKSNTRSGVRVTRGGRGITPVNISLDKKDYMPYIPTI